MAQNGTPGRRFWIASAARVHAASTAGQPRQVSTKPHSERKTGRCLSGCDLERSSRAVIPRDSQKRQVATLQN
eukprot:3189472-Rhodomonas_salina.2